MNSIGEDCSELKTKYDSCFNSWFSEKFLKGSSDDSDCKSLFKIYQKCVQNALQIHQINIEDLRANHIDGKEFEEENKSTDPPKDQPGSSKSTSS